MSWRINVAIFRQKKMAKNARHFLPQIAVAFFCQESFRKIGQNIAANSDRGIEPCATT
jgi:hypothetical protein